MAIVHEDVQYYYGQLVKQTGDLKTDVCCSKAEIPPFIQEILKKIHPEIVAK